MTWHPDETQDRQILGLLYVKFSAGAIVSLKRKKPKRIVYANILLIVSGD